MYSVVSEIKPTLLPKECQDPNGYCKSLNMAMCCLTMCILFLFCTYSWGCGGLMNFPPDQAVKPKALARGTELCSWTRQFTLTVPLSTQVYKWVLVNLMLEVTLCCEFECFQWQVVCSLLRMQGCRKQQQEYLFHTNAVIPRKTSQQAHARLVTTPGPL